MFTPVIDFLYQWVAAHPAATLGLAYAACGGGLGFVLGYLVLLCYPEYRTAVVAEGRTPMSSTGLFWTGMVMGVLFWPMFVAGWTFFCGGRLMWRVGQAIRPAAQHYHVTGVRWADGTPADGRKE